MSMHADAPVRLPIQQWTSRSSYNLLSQSLPTNFHRVLGNAEFGPESASDGRRRREVAPVFLTAFAVLAVSGGSHKGLLVDQRVSRHNNACSRSPLRDTGRQIAASNRLIRHDSRQWRYSPQDSHYWVYEAPESSNTPLPVKSLGDAARTIWRLIVNAFSSWGIMWGTGDLGDSISLVKPVT